MIQKEGLKPYFSKHISKLDGHNCNSMNTPILSIIVRLQI